MNTAAEPKICMVVYTDYRFDARVRREAETLAAAGFRVTCLTPRNGSGPKQYELRGVRVRELAAKKYRGKRVRSYLGSYLHFLASAMVACTSMLASGGVDVVHVHNVPDFLVAAGLIPRLFGKRVILDIHDSVPETYAAKFPNGSKALSNLLRWEERLSMALAHRVICVNHPQRDALVERGLRESKSFVSMNVPDHRLFTSQALPNGNHDNFRLIYHGTMANRLGVDLIIRAVAELSQRLPNLQLHLWGQGDDLDSFRRLSAELGQEGRIFFRPEGFPVHELPTKLVDMDLGVVGNRCDCAEELMLPVKLLEYIAMGVPVVAPRLKTIQHYFDDDMVTFYTAENVDSLAEAILRLHSSSRRRREQAIKARTFLDNHGWQRQSQDLVAMYRSLLER